MNKINYVKCPRCDLNWIDSRQDMCDICKAELGLAPNTLLADDLEFEEIRELCPVCKRNYINFDEDMCERCAKVKEDSIAVATVVEDDDSWRAFLDEELPEEEEIEIPLEELKEEEDVAFDDEEVIETFKNNDEDFEFVDLSDLDDLDDDDLDDEDEDI